MFQTRASRGLECSEAFLSPCGQLQLAKPYINACIGSCSTQMCGWDRQFKGPRGFPSALCVYSNGDKAQPSSVLDGLGPPWWHDIK